MKYHLAVVVHLHKALFQPQILTLTGSYVRNPNLLL